MFPAVKNRMKQRVADLPLHAKIMLAGTAALFIPFVIAGIIIYSNLSSSLEKQAAEKSIQIANGLSAVIETSLNSQVHLAALIAADPAVVNALSEKNYTAADAHLRPMLSREKPFYRRFFLADRNGIVKTDILTKDPSVLDQQAIPKTMNFSNRDYFIKAKEGKTSILGPVVSPLTGQQIIIVSAPIYNGKEFLGIAVLTLGMDFINNNISRVKTGETGFASLIDGQGTFISHPKKEYLLKRTIEDDEPGMQDIGGEIKNQKTGYGKYHVGDRVNMAGFARVPNTGWTVIFTQNMDEILMPMRKTLLFVSLVALLFLIIASAAMSAFSHTISTPVEKTIEMMKQVTAHSTETIICTDLGGKIIFANPTAQKFLGKNENELIGTVLPASPSRAAVEEDIKEALMAGRTWTGILRHGLSKNEETTHSTIIIPLKNEKGGVHSFLAVGTDITEKVSLEKRMQQAEKMEAIGTLAGGIAHDFNNILAGVLGYAELSLMIPDNPKKTKQYLREIRTATMRARDLTRQILTFSRQTTAESSRVLPALIIKEAVKLLRASTPAVIDIRTNIASNAAIMADPSQIHQMIVNLCANSVHAIGMNPGCITIDFEDLLADEEFTNTHPDIKTGKHILLRISDTGCGIPPEALGHIFEPFFTTKGQGEGTGLGLSVVHGIVKKLGGSVSVHSEPGKGTAFSIIIPATEQESTDVDRQEQSMMTGGTERILLVDDEKAIVESFRTILTNLGYRVTAFMDSREALTTFQNNPEAYDLVITDHSMPHMTGLELAKNMKQAKIDIPIVIMSGYVDRSREDATASSAIMVFLKKPVSTCQLAAAIRKALAPTITA